MRIKFVETESRSQAKKTCPWASRATKVCGGFMCFESITDYEIMMATPDEINVKVDSFEAALEYLGRENNACMGGIPDKHAKAMVAMYKLFTIAEAWNKADGFVPDYDNTNQHKYFPWLKKRGTEGFVCTSTYDTASGASASFGSRLCFKTEERAEQFGNQFIDLWNDFLLFR